MIISMQTPGGAMAEVNRSIDGSFTNWYIPDALARPGDGYRSRSAFFTVREAAEDAMRWIADAAETEIASK